MLTRFLTGGACAVGLTAIAVTPAAANPYDSRFAVAADRFSLPCLVHLPRVWS
jgi:hypothetical protein